MPEIIIHYTSPKTLQVLKSFAKYFDFSIFIPKHENGKRTRKEATDEITMLSEESLSEAWNSPEDERWDELYKK